jgi:subtilisin family serine protease
MAHGQASQSGRRVEWWHPGEVVLVARVPSGTTKDHLRAAFPRGARGLDPTRLRSFIFGAPTERTSLAFMFAKLTSGTTARDVRDTVEELNNNPNDLATGDLQVLGVMPHWHLKAHELSGGGSPGSQPAPVQPGDLPSGARRVWYAPTADHLAQPSDTPVPVAVLDTRINLGSIEDQGNEQLRETVTWLAQHSQDDPPRAQEWQEVEQHHAEAARAAGQLQTYDMADHGLFIAGLIHAAAPTAPIAYEPVLDETGVGDLSLVLLALEHVLAAKDPNDPQIINLSLGFRPHPSRLAAAWYGLPRPNDTLYVPAEELTDPARDLRWAAARKRQIRERVDLLQLGLDELGRYLSLNNCLVVAAAGNDSLRAVQSGQQRLDPRLPARFDTVLGVAATLDDGSAAAYSNAGDDLQLGDHLATFGGGVGPNDLPVNGVLGVYSGAFPSPGANGSLKGWAWWSGTSFATGIMSGIVANYWGNRRGSHASQVIADLQSEADGEWLAELRTPVVRVERHTD